MMNRGGSTVTVAFPRRLLLFLLVLLLRRRRRLVRLKKPPHRRAESFITFNIQLLVLA